MPTVLITPEAMREQPHPYVELLREAGFEIRYPQNPYFARGLGSEDEVVAELAGADASIASGEHYSAGAIRRLPRLRVIARAGVGYDRVDVAAATARNVVVTITPTSNHEAVAELTLALLFAVAKSVVRNDRAVRAGQWPRQLLLPVRGQTLGILGLGRIGQTVARRAAALGMRVLATESHPDRAFIDQHGVELVGFDDLLAESDVLSVHCPLTEATRGLFNRRTLQRMKPGSIFLNTARGGVVHEPDLVDALQQGPLYGAGLDVFAVEPPVEDNPLLALDNVVVSPHLAGADERSMVAMGVEAADCIIRLYRGQWPTGAVVNNQLQDRWRW